MGGRERCVRVAAFSTSVAALLWSTGAGAADCTVNGPRPHLDGTAVDWTLVIASGQSCIRGLRSGSMVLDGVRISTAARAGEARVEGYGFVYKAPPGFTGDDSFSVTLSGKEIGIGGVSTVNVHVSVR